MKEIIKYGLILGIICFLAGSVLALVNSITEPKIKSQKQEQEALALREVMAESVDFTARYHQNEVIYYTAYDTNGKINGFAVKCRGKGYSSEIEILAGLNSSLEINKVKILSQNETPSLGSRILEESFLGQFRGKDLSAMHQVETITGATISSEALIRALKTRIGELTQQLTGELNNGR